MHHASHLLLPFWPLYHVVFLRLTAHPSEAAPPKDDPVAEQRSLTADDLTDEDRSARLAGPTPAVEPAVAAFLEEGNLAHFEEMLARRGVTSMEALAAPWLRVAEGFLVDKVGVGGKRGGGGERARVCSPTRRLTQPPSSPPPFPPH